MLTIDPWCYSGGYGLRVFPIGWCRHYMYSVHVYTRSPCSANLYCRERLRDRYIGTLSLFSLPPPPPSSSFLLSRAVNAHRLSNLVTRACHATGCTTTISRAILLEPYDEFFVRMHNAPVEFITVRPCVYVITSEARL